jgi:hypothetical protein
MANLIASCEDLMIDSVKMAQDWLEFKRCWYEYYWRHLALEKAKERPNSFMIESLNLRLERLKKEGEETAANLTREQNLQFLRG